MTTKNRLMDQSVLHVRKVEAPSGLQVMTSATAKRAVVLLVLIGLILFLYLAEVSQLNTTAFEIQDLERQYQQLQEANRELEREIAELESPTHVLEFARQNGFTPVYDADPLYIERAEPQE